MLYSIQQVHTNNFESRQNYIPIVICNHITDGPGAVRTSDEHEEQAVQNTFISPNSNASAHFDILRDGRIKQYVEITQAAWTQGIALYDLPQAPSPIVRQMGVNPNLYCVSKEYEAYGDHGGYGNITEAQFWAGLWLDKYIQTEVKKAYNTTMQLNNSFVIGHCDIDPINRKFDPGAQFPWTHYFAEFAIIQNMTLDETEQYILAKTSPLKVSEQCFQVMNEIRFLMSLASNKNSWATAQLQFVATTFDQQAVLPDKYAGNWGQFYNDVLFIYNQSISDSPGWGIGELQKVYPILKSKGLVS